MLRAGRPGGRGPDLRADELALLDGEEAAGDGLIRRVVADGFTALERYRAGD